MVLLNKIKNKLHLNYRKKRWPGLIQAYKQYLPVTKKTPIISLNEGNTPLILSDSISNLIGNGTKVFLKYDGLNPTGSFKDRGMTMAISKAKEPVGLSPSYFKKTFVPFPINLLIESLRIRGVFPSFKEIIGVALVTGRYCL